MSDFEFFDALRAAVISYYKAQKKPTRTLALHLVGLVNKAGAERGINFNFELKHLGVKDAQSQRKTLGRGAKKRQVQTG